jgi:hypothetical protein
VPPLLTDSVRRTYRSADGGFSFSPKAMKRSPYLAYGIRTSREAATKGLLHSSLRVRKLKSNEITQLCPIADFFYFARSSTWHCALLDQPYDVLLLTMDSDSRGRTWE